MFKLKEITLQNFIHTILKLCVIIFLIVAVSTKQEYSFYILLRWIVSIISFYLFLFSSKKKEIGWIVCFLTLTYLFNPIIKISFQRQTWQLLDYLVLVVYIIAIVVDWIQINFQNTEEMKKSKFEMGSPLKSKRTVAREILIFFGAVVFAGIIWGFLLLRNFYFENKKISLNEELYSLKTQLDSLPTDKIKGVYEIVKNDFVVSYRVDYSFDKGTPKLPKGYVLDTGNYSVLKKYEIDFLKDFPNAKKVSPNSNGFFYLKESNRIYNKWDKYIVDDSKDSKVTENKPADKDPFEGLVFQEDIQRLKDFEDMMYVRENVPIEVQKWEPPEVKHNKKPPFDPNKEFEEVKLTDPLGLLPPPPKKHSSILFDYVELGKFRDFIKNKNYRDTLFLKFFYGVNPLMYSNFVADMEKNNYYKDIELSNERLNNQIKSAEDESNNIKYAYLDNDGIRDILIGISLVIVLILYPLRLCFFLIKWAVITVKQK